MGVGLALRLVGLKYGLPNLYYWDEPTVVNRAVRFGSGDLNPHFFYYPALYMYAIFAAIGAYFAAGRALGIVHGARDFMVGFFTQPTAIYVVARFLTALVGLAGVAATFLVGRRYFGARVGLIAAALLAVSPLSVSYSHVAVCDTAHAFLITAACLPLHGVLRRGRPRDYVAAGALIGLGIATKYLAGMHLVTLLVAHALRDEGWPARRKSLRAFATDAVSPRLACGVVAMLGAFFVGSPYNIVSLGAFVQDFRAQAALTAGAPRSFGALLALVPSDLGLPACAFVLVGLASVAARPSRAWVVFLTFPAIYAVALVGMSKVFTRYLLPQTMFLAVLAAHGVVTGYGLLARRMSARASTWALGAAVVAVLAFPAWRTVTWVRMTHAQLDTRTDALAWFVEHVPAGAGVALQSLYGRSFDNVPLVTDATLSRLERILPEGGALGSARAAILDDWRTRTVYASGPWERGVGALRDAGVQYVVLTDVYGPPPAPIAAWLADAGRVVAQFNPDLPPILASQSLSGLLALMPPRLTVYAIEPGVPPSDARSRPTAR